MELGEAAIRRADGQTLGVFVLSSLVSFSGSQSLENSGVT